MTVVRFEIKELREGKKVVEDPGDEEVADETERMQGGIGIRWEVFEKERT